MDAWVVQVLVDIGSFVRAAAPALDYEVGRVVSGVDRPLGNFPNNLSWQNAGITAGLKEANAWIAAGEVARDNKPAPEMQQRALTALLRPIANISCHSWLHDLANALDALRFGETHGIVAALPSRLHGYKQGRTVWVIRLQALAWGEFHYQAGLMKKTEALGEVAAAFGRSDLGSISNWERRAEELFGRAVVQEELLWSAAAGRRYRFVQNQLASGKLERSAVAHEMEYFDRVFGLKRLEILAMGYKAQARKSPKEKNNRGSIRG